MAKAKAAELEAALKNLREERKKLQQEKKKEQEERKRVREEKKLQKLNLKLKKMDANEKVDKQKERVILGVQDRPCLWDKSSAEYKNRYAKEIAWKEVARDLDLDIEKVKTMWNNLVDQVREIWRNESYHSGDGLDDKIEESKTWKFYKSMEFYRKVYKFRKTDSNFQVAGFDNLSDSEGEEMDERPLAFEDSSLTGFGDGIEDDDAGGNQSQISSHESQSLRSPSTNIKSSDSQVEISQSSIPNVHSQVENTQASSSGSSSSREIRNQKSKVQNSSSRKSTATKKPDRKRKHDEIDEKLLSHMELASKIFTEPEDPTEKFLAYLGENLRTVPVPKRKKCEQKVLQIVNAYNDDDELEVTVTIVPKSQTEY